MPWRQPSFYFILLVAVVSLAYGLAKDNIYFVILSACFVLAMSVAALNARRRASTKS